MINLLDEWNLMKVNIRDLKVNQRLLNFPYFIGVLALTFEMLGINLFLILGIVKSLKYKFDENFDTFVFSSNYTFAHGTFFILTIMVNIIIFYAFSELIKRRLNDYFDSNIGRYAQYIVFAFNLLLLLQWGIQQRITLIDLESTLHLYVYFFYECIAFFALVLLPSKKRIYMDCQEGCNAAEIMKLLMELYILKTISLQTSGIVLAYHMH